MLIHHLQNFFIQKRASTINLEYKNGGTFLLKNGLKKRYLVTVTGTSVVGHDRDPVMTQILTQTGHDPDRS
jgi:hypothetical protein